MSRHPRKFAQASREVCVRKRGRDALPQGNNVVLLHRSTQHNASAHMYQSIEICAGAGGQALGLEMAGFAHVALVEYEKEVL